MEIQFGLGAGEWKAPLEFLRRFTHQFSDRMRRDVKHMKNVSEGGSLRE